MKEVDIQPLFLGIAILFSAFFSGTETAYISANSVKIEIWVRQKMGGAVVALDFLQKPEKFLMTTLIGNNISMVAASSLMVYYADRFITLPGDQHWRGILISVISAFLLLTFGEIIPKSFCSDQATWVAVRVSFFLRGIYFILFPIIYIVRKITGWITRLFHVDQRISSQIFSRKDMERLVREGGKSGVVEAKHQDLISRLLLRGDFKVRDVMVPRTEIVAVNKRDSISMVRQVLTETGYSRLPVTGSGIDDIVGVITAKDVILKKPKRINQVLREVLFVPESRKMASFLREIQTRTPDMAIVIDEHGGTAGLVTLEDMIEEFFGDIQDEYDDDINMYRKEISHQIDVRARISIHELNAKHRLHIPEGEYNTLAGFLMEKFGHIPRRGEKVELPECILLVLSATRRQVNWIRIHKKELKS